MTDTELRQRIRAAVDLARYEHRGEPGDAGLDYLYDLAVAGARAKRGGQAFPCKPGDVLYVDSGCLFFHDDNSYTECEVVNIRIGKRGGWRLYLRPLIDKEIGHYHAIFPASAIGNTVWLNRLDAELAMNGAKK